MIAEAKLPDLKRLGMSDVLIDLLQKVLAKDPADRAGVGDCLQHQFCVAAREQRIRELGDEVERHDERIIPRRHDLRQVRICISYVASLYSTTHLFSIPGLICNKTIICCSRYCLKIQQKIISRQKAFF